MMCKQGIARRERRGSVLFAALVVVMVLAAMSSALLSFGSSSTREAVGARDSARALYLAEAGMNEALARFAAAAEEPTLDPPKAIGSKDAPMSLGTGEFWVDITEVEAEKYARLVAYGNAGTESRAVEVVLAAPKGGIYSSAIFAGNESGDPNYALGLGGVGGQGDEVLGDIYSAGDVVVQGDASVEGDIYAGGSVEGAKGEEGIKQPTPDINAMDYANNNDVDVLAAFQRGAATYESDATGGRAWQLPEADPAHIFRVNPSDRKSEYMSTEKEDFFLEDPYEPVRTDANSDGKDATPITLSGTMGRPGPDGTDLVYYIDGNLWLHNYKTFSFKFMHEQDSSTKVTFVVKGNIYFSDNLYYLNKQKDGVAFIAITDDKVEDSGNIYFGDPEFGTLEYMSAFMYAENNFYDTNLDAKGSAEVTVVGNMTAGNQVAITRDWGDQHSKLTVEFDDRIMTGELDLPGLPPNKWSEEDYQVVSWREVSPRQ